MCLHLGLCGHTVRILFHDVFVNVYHNASSILRTDGLTFTPLNFHSNAQKSADSIRSFWLSGKSFVSTVLQKLLCFKICLASFRD